MATSLFLNLLANTIIQDYFQNSRCMFMLSDSTDPFVYKGNISVVNLRLINASVDDKIIFRSYGCQKFIIQHRDAGAIVIDLEQKMKLHGDRFNFRKYLILPGLNSSEKFIDILKLPIMQYIANILIIIPDEVCDKDCDVSFNTFCKFNGTFKLITHKYVGASFNNDPVVLDWWFSTNQSFLRNNELYPDKITNQGGRILRCATFNYEPYSIIGNSPRIAIGSENSLIHEYAKRHNMTVQYILDDDEWGIIRDNWTGSGILGNIATDKADIGFGALYTWEHEYGFLDLSKPVIRSGVTCLVPAPRLAAGWLTPFFPFSLKIWIDLGLSYMATSLATNLIAFLALPKLHMKIGNCKKKQNSKIAYKEILGQSFWTIYSIFLGQSVPKTNKDVERALKYMFVVFLFGLLMTSSYGSGLASVMTIPRYEGAINTVWDLANSRMPWGGTQDAWLFSILDEQRPEYVTLRETFRSTSAENLMALAKTNQFSFPIERLPSGQFAIGNYITESAVKKLRLMHEDLYWEYCVFMLRKSSPLLDSLNKIILELTQAGVIKFWEMRAAEIHMNLRVQNIVRYYASTKDEDREGTVKLQWTHVEGTFGILAVGYVMAAICFVIEMVFSKYNSKTRIHTGNS